MARWSFGYSRSHVDRAGDRIRKTRRAHEEPSPHDLALLVQRRLTAVLHDVIGLDPGDFSITARPLKTPEAIMAKLLREPTRLSTMQDIAGTRIVVPGLRPQARMREAVEIVFENEAAHVTMLDYPSKYRRIRLINR